MPYTVYYENLDLDEDMKIDPQDFSYENPTLGNADGSAPIFAEKKSGLIDRLLGKGVPSYLKLTAEDRELLGAFLPAMKAAGVSRCLVSYDGGSDEGFGKIERCEAADGSAITPETLIADPEFIEMVEPVVTSLPPPVFRPEGEQQDVTALARDTLEFELPVVLASILLGRGYGTGEYELYGRAFVDLETMTITDDPKAPYPNGSSN